MYLTHLKQIIGISLAVFVFSLFTACSESNNPLFASSANENLLIDDETIAALPTEELSDSENVGLIFMREEEKLARDVYITLYNKWGQRVFGNISNSEQRHTDAIKLLIDKYQLSDPVISDSVSSFTNGTLANLYTTLTVQGDSSLVHALKVGALIEEIDILDLQRELDENVNNEDIKYVYERLLNGSYNHLRAFVRNLDRNGINYSPVKMSEEQYRAIIYN